MIERRNHFNSRFFVGFVGVVMTFGSIILIAALSLKSTIITGSFLAWAALSMMFLSGLAHLASALTNRNWK